MSRYGRLRKRPTVEGRRAVIEALRAGREIEQILMQDDADLGPQLREIVFLANGAGITVNGVSRHDLDRQSATRKHQGVIALVRDTRYVQIEDLVFAADGLNEPPLLVVLDGVQDPHNLGAIARTVDAAGGHGIIIPERRAAGVTAGAIRASAGALEHVRVARVTNVAKSAEYLKTIGLNLIGLDQDAPGHYAEPDYTVPTVIVVGSEERGIAPGVKSACHSLISIPLRGNMASLNASVAAAIVLYEAVRQRSAVGNVPHKVNPRDPE